MLANRSAEPEFLQPFLPMFTKHEELVWTEDANRRDKARKSQQRAPRLRRIRFEEDPTTGYFWDLDRCILDLPLGGLEEGNELNVRTGLLDQEIEVEAVIDDAETTEPWSDEAVGQLHEAVLLHSLKALQARGNATEKREILKWIFTPIPMIATLRDENGEPAEVLLPQNATPFSFEMCCRFCGYSPDALRQSLAPILKEIGLLNPAIEEYLP